MNALLIALVILALGFYMNSPWVILAAFVIPVYEFIVSRKSHDQKTSMKTSLATKTKHKLLEGYVPPTPSKDMQAWRQPSPWQKGIGVVENEFGKPNVIEGMYIPSVTNPTYRRPNVDPRSNLFKDFPFYNLESVLKLIHLKKKK